MSKMAAAVMLERAQAIANTDKQAGIEMLNQIVHTDAKIDDEETVRVKEQSILELGQLLSKAGRAEELVQLIKFTRPFLGLISKAKAAKLVRALVDIFLDMEAGTGFEIMVSPDSRNTAWVSFDGRKRQELCHGDSLRVTTSIYPVPSICSQDQISDWFDSLAECLHWNVRKKQRHFDELSDLTHSSSNDTLDSLDRHDHLDS